MKIEQVLQQFLQALLKLTFLFFLVIPSAHGELSIGMEADIIIGQADFTTSGSATTQAGLSAPYFISTDGTHLVVGEQVSDRILMWNKIPEKNGEPADVVVGKLDFVTSGDGTTDRLFAVSRGVFIDGTRLFIADWGNHRVLIYNSIPTTNGEAADVVLGQTDFTSSSSGTTATTMNRPIAAFSDGTRLLVTDGNNSRILIWNTIPTSSTTAPDVVVGQVDFTSSVSAATQRNFNGVSGIYWDGKHLFAADFSNNRVLIWNSFPTTNGAPADVVLGQPDFVTATGGLAQNKLMGPISVYSDGRRIFVADNTNRRVMVWNKIPTKNGVAADFVIGQKDFKSASFGVTPSEVISPLGITGDGKRLFVSDFSGNRILIYNIATSSIDLGPQFTQGKSVLGKVFWDFNKSGYQDTGEYGVEGVKVVSDTGIYAITDEDGKYHYPFIQVGQRILKLDPITLPEGATVTTENPRKIIVTEGILTKVSFGLYSDVREVLTEDDGLLLKVSIAQDPSKLAPQLSVSAEVTNDTIIFTINTNYHLFIKRGELKLFDQNQNLIQTIELPQPLPLHHEIPANDAIAYFQLSVYDTHNNEDRTGLAQISSSVS